MGHHETIDSLCDYLSQDTSSARSTLIYAPNTVGKTRLAQQLKDRDSDGVVIYNSYVEDVFSWDNDGVALKMNLESELLRIIESQGLDRLIVDNFKAFTSGKIEPLIDFASGEVVFGIYTGDDTTTDRIKVSRAEESIFVWCVYYTVLSESIEILSVHEDLRATTDYDGLTLAVIDDPVSSMDDVRIVTVALYLADLIKRAKEEKLDLKFLVTTHHALFFNVLFNSLRRQKSKAYVLSRARGSGWNLKVQSKDSPFSYHLELINDIQQAIERNSIQRQHFNQFRTLLEKTATFLGYTHGWGELLAGPDSALLTQVLNLYSHDRFADLDSSEVATEYKDALKSEFQKFLKTFRWADPA